MSAEDEIAEYLTAQYDVDEDHARLLDEHASGHERPYNPVDPTDPARVLADLAAKRRHVAMWHDVQADVRARLARLNAAPTRDGALLSRLNIEYFEGLGMQLVIRDVLRADVNVFAGRLGFKPEWRIDG